MIHVNCSLPVVGGLAGMLRVRPGLLLAIVLAVAALTWQYKFRDYTPFSVTHITQAQADFRRYALRNYDIAQFEYHGGNEIWVRAMRTQAVDRVDAARIVEEIASDYRSRIDSDEKITVYLLHPIHQDVLARTTK